MPIDAERVQSVFLAAIASTTAQELRRDGQRSLAGDAQCAAASRNSCGTR